MLGGNLGSLLYGDVSVMASLFRQCQSTKKKERKKGKKERKAQDKAALTDSGFSHFVPKPFRTHVISYHFGHFVPTLFILVILCQIWSFSIQFGHFVPTFIFSFKIILVISSYVLLFIGT